MSFYPSLNLDSTKESSGNLNARELLDEITRLEENVNQRLQKLIHTGIPAVVKGKPVPAREKNTDDDLNDSNNTEELDSSNDLDEQGSVNDSNRFYALQLQTTDDLTQLYPPEIDSAQYQPTLSDSDENSVVDMEIS